MTKPHHAQMKVTGAWKACNKTDTGRVQEVQQKIREFEIKIKYCSHTERILRLQEKDAKSKKIEVANNGLAKSSTHCLNVAIILGIDPTKYLPIIAKPQSQMYICGHLFFRGFFLLLFRFEITGRILAKWHSKGLHSFFVATRLISLQPVNLAKN